MLILTRRPQEAIRIGEDVTVTVLGIEGNKVRIGISAPRHIAVDRQEVHDRKLRDGAPNGSDPLA
jgi:carbon storage regulator